MKKIFCLLLMMFVITGCDVEYNLRIDGDSFDEEITATLPNTDTFKYVVDNISKVKQPSYINDNTGNKDYYKSKITNDSDFYKLNYTYSYDENSIKFSNAINQCYKYFFIDTSAGYIDISTSPKFTCFYRDGSPVADSITINIITSSKVVSNNADKVDGNKYSWVIDKTNSENKPLEIKIEKPKKVDKNNQTVIIVIILLAVMSAIGYIIYRFMRSKHIKTNEI